MNDPSCHLCPVSRFPFPVFRFLLLGSFLVLFLLPSPVRATSCTIADNTTNTFHIPCVLDGISPTTGSYSYISGVTNGDIVADGATVTVAPNTVVTWSPGNAIKMQNGGSIVMGTGSVLKQTDPMTFIRQSLGFDTYAAGSPVTVLGQNLQVCTGNPCTVSSPAGTGNLVVEGSIKFADGTTQSSAPVAAAPLPNGLIGYFNAACPTNWTEVTAAQGRYIVGLPSSGTLAGTAGTALTNQENRAVGQHTHTITDPGHSHGFLYNNVNNYGGAGVTNGLGYSSSSTYTATTGISIASAGSVAGTNAPYVQYRTCQYSGNSGADTSTWGTSGNNIYNLNSANVGIGTNGPGQKLSVAGTVESTTGGFKFPDGTTQTTAVTAVAGLPTGSVMFFNLASCPSGWTDQTSTWGGRYVVANTTGGTLAGTAGTALTNQENRAVGQHTHTITDPGHGHSLSMGSGNCCGATMGPVWNSSFGSWNSSYISSSTTGISINNSGSVAGTNAPYVQLLICQKS